MTHQIESSGLRAQNVLRLLVAHVAEKENKKQTKKNKQITLFIHGFWSSCEANFSEFDTHTRTAQLKTPTGRRQAVGYFQNLMDMTQVSLKTNPDMVRVGFQPRTSRTQIEFEFVFAFELVLFTEKIL